MYFICKLCKTVLFDVGGINKLQRGLSSLTAASRYNFNKLCKVKGHDPSRSAARKESNLIKPEQKTVSFSSTSNNPSTVLLRLQYVSMLTASHQFLTTSPSSPPLPPVSESLTCSSSSSSSSCLLLFLFVFSVFFMPVLCSAFCTFPLLASIEPRGEPPGSEVTRRKSRNGLFSCAPLWSDAGTEQKSSKY